MEEGEILNKQAKVGTPWYTFYSKSFFFDQC